MTCVEQFEGFKRWGPGNNGDPELNIINHHNKHVINRSEYNENWEDYLEDLSLESYRDFALEKSKVMTHRMVNSNGSRVYLSGFYKNVLIIGRLDNINEFDQLGISSCYIIHDDLLEKKFATFERHRCFSF